MNCLEHSICIPLDLICNKFCCAIKLVSMSRSTTPKIRKKSKNIDESGNSSNVINLVEWRPVSTWRVKFLKKLTCRLAVIPLLIEAYDWWLMYKKYTLTQILSHGFFWNSDERLRIITFLIVFVKGILSNCFKDSVKWILLSEYCRLDSDGWIL